MAQLFKLCSFAILLSASSALDGDLPALEDFLNFSGETSAHVGGVAATPTGRRSGQVATAAFCMLSEPGCGILDLQPQGGTSAASSMITHLGSCQNYGPFLGTLNIRCRLITRTQKVDLNFDNHPSES